MTKFCFYFGDDPTLADRLRQAAAAVWSPMSERTLGAFRLLVPGAADPHDIGESADVMGAVTGYVRDDGPKDHGNDGQTSGRGGLLRFLTELGDAAHWPLGDDWTGSFSAVAYDATRRQVVLANDLLGCWPLYYATPATGFVGGTSLIVLGRCLQAAADPVGVLQRVTTPYANYGRRTLLEGISRLLPGERVAFAQTTGSTTSRFDTSLCGEVLPEDLQLVAPLVWQQLHRETALAAQSAERVAVAMSGGWDSRLVLGSLAAVGVPLECLTYGDEDHYESAIARRCAGTVGARHRSFSIAHKYFPSRDCLEPMVQETESANYMEWYSLLDATGGDGAGDMTLFLGDLCESMVGRYLADFASRGARVRSFARGLVGIPDSVPAATPAAFLGWKERRKRQILDDLQHGLARLSPALRSECVRADWSAQTESDLEWSFARVEDQRPPFAPMFDELFTWFHRVRFLLANQLPFLAYRFRPVCPALSTRFLRLITRVHPRLRIRRRLMDAIAQLPDFQQLGAIPSAQCPWLSSRAPAMLRDLVWGMRSGLDQVLIKAVLRSGNRWKRQRVLRSLDLIQEYQREGLAATVAEWFSGNWIDGTPYVRLVQQRASLEAWPLIGVDLSAPANVSITLDLCLSDSSSSGHAGEAHAEARRRGGN